MKKILRLLELASLVASLLVLSACGGGSSGGSSTPATSILSGVAAVGTPIASGNISVICAAGSALAPTTTSSTGTWQITLSGQTLPCAIELSGGTINGVPNATPYHSIATTTGTVNVTPLTDLMVANLAGTTPGTWFAGLSATPTSLTAITQTQVDAALVNLSAALPALTPLSTSNPITTVFTPTPGNVSDDMLTALATAMTNAGVTYSALLDNTSANVSLSAGFGSALVIAYTGYTIGGTVSGLSGTVMLQDNGGDNHSVSTNGNFTFSRSVTDGGSYNVTVLTQPVGQTCTVSAGTGAVSGSNVTNVTVICATNTYNVNGNVSGLTGSVVLQNNNGNSLTVSSNGGFTFSAQVASGSPYSVTALTQPAGQSCSIVNGSGTITQANVTNVSVTCSAYTYTIGGTVSGLSGSMVLQNNGGDNRTISANGSFTFPSAIAYGNTYNITMYSQPSGQTCTVTGGSGTATASVTSVAVNCTNTSAALPAGYVSQGGLIWMPASAIQYNYAQATALCAGAINGQTGWSLPTVNALDVLYTSGAMMGHSWTLGETWTSDNFAVGAASSTVRLDSGLNSMDMVDQYHYVSCVKSTVATPPPPGQITLVQLNACPNTSGSTSTQFWACFSGTSTGTENYQAYPCTVMIGNGQISLSIPADNNKSMASTPASPSYIKSPPQGLNPVISSVGSSLNGGGYMIALSYYYDLSVTVINEGAESLSCTFTLQ